MSARTFTPDALRHIRAEHGLSQRALVDEIDRVHNTVSLMRISIFPRAALRSPASSCWQGESGRPIVERAGATWGGLRRESTWGVPRSGPRPRRRLLQELVQAIHVRLPDG